MTPQRFKEIIARALLCASPDELASELSISRETVMRWQSGRSAPSTIESRRRIARQLDDIFGIMA